MNMRLLSMLTFAAALHSTDEGLEKKPLRKRAEKTRKTKKKARKVARASRRINQRGRT